MTPNQTYVSSTDNEDLGIGYTIDRVAEILSQKWFVWLCHDFVRFFGWIDREHVESLLRSESFGTFLIRCGTEPTSFSLAASDGITVSHWQIFTHFKPQPNSYTYTISGQSFDSLEKLIENFKSNDLARKNMSAIRLFQNKPKTDANISGSGVTIKGRAQILSNVILASKDLGGGNFGQVYEGKWDGYTVACKQLKNVENWNAMKEEIALLAALNHPSIVRVILLLF